MRLFGPVPLLPLDYVEICKEEKKASLSVVIQFGKCRFMLAATSLVYSCPHLTWAVVSLSPEVEV